MISQIVLITGPRGSGKSYIKDAMLSLFDESLHCTLTLTDIRTMSDIWLQDAVDNKAVVCIEEVNSIDNAKDAVRKLHVISGEKLKHLILVGQSDFCPQDAIPNSRHITTRHTVEDAPGESIIKKAAQWDALEKEVNEACFTYDEEKDEFEEKEDSDLLTIGEIAARHLHIF